MGLRGVQVIFSIIVLGLSAYRMSPISRVFPTPY